MSVRGFAASACIVLSGLVAGPSEASPDGARPECRVWADPVVSLAFGSRYRADSETRSEIDEAANAAVNAALRPVDAFIRELATEANQVLLRPDDTARAHCLVSSLRAWADAGALGDLQTFAARISVGGRLAGLALAYAQVRDSAGDAGDVAAIDRWLQAAAREELRFWAEDATPGAQKGNLRAWSALSVIAIGIATGEPALVADGTSVMEMLMCTAEPDGGLPQEMRRGKYALHYQLHAISPMVASVALLRTQGIDLAATCEQALRRIVDFAVSDLDTGRKAQERSGAVQSYFDGTEALRPHELAWAELYLAMIESPELEGLVAPLRPLGNSKLGGNQRLVVDSLLPGFAAP